MRILILAALVAGAGCTSQLKSPDASSRVASAPVAVLAASSESTARVATEATEEFKPPKGYRKRVEGSATYYCTKVVVLGSRFEKDDCHTLAELKDLELQRQSMKGEMKQRINMCSSAAVCANP